MNQINITELKESTKLKQCQGDVNIYRLSKDPKIKGKIYKDTTLVYGDTGNHHKLVKGKFQVKQTEDKLLVVKVTRTTTLTHEQHGPIELKPGMYLIDRAKEKGMFDDMIAPVVD